VGSRRNGPQQSTRHDDDDDEGHPRSLNLAPIESAYATSY